MTLDSLRFKSHFTFKVSCHLTELRCARASQHILWHVLLMTSIVACSNRRVVPHLCFSRLRSFVIFVLLMFGIITLLLLVRVTRSPRATAFVYNMARCRREIQQRISFIKTPLLNLQWTRYQSNRYAWNLRFKKSKMAATSRKHCLEESPQNPFLLSTKTIIASFWENSQKDK